MCIIFFSVLQIGLHSNVSSVGFEALSTLPHLRHLVFGDSMKEWRQEQKCLMLCSKFLPHLRVAGHRIDVLDLNTIYDLRRHRHFFLNSHRYHHQIVRQRQPNKLSLENLMLSYDVQPHENCQLPELKSLSLCMPRGDVLGLCDRFSTISELGLHETDSPDLVITVLRGLGRRLRTLVLTEVPHALSLGDVLSYCPNLERWRFEFCNFVDNSNVWPEGCMSCLEEAYFGYHRKVPPGFLLQVEKNIYLYAQICLDI
jgi:hypothetical protein